MAKKDNIKYYIKILLGAILVIMFWLGATTEVKLFGEDPDLLVVGGVIFFVVVATMVMVALATPILIYQFIKSKRKEPQSKDL